MNKPLLTFGKLSRWASTFGFIHLPNASSGACRTLFSTVRESLTFASGAFEPHSGAQHSPKSLKQGFAEFFTAIAQEVQP